MEVIKKKIKRSTTINNGKIVPNLNTSYYVKILLTSKSLDWGFFDVVDNTYYGGYNYYDSGDPIGLLNLV